MDWTLFRNRAKQLNPKFLLLDAIHRLEAMIDGTNEDVSAIDVMDPGVMSEAVPLLRLRRLRNGETSALESIGRLNSIQKISRKMPLGSGEMEAAWCAEWFAAFDRVSLINLQTGDLSRADSAIAELNGLRLLFEDLLRRAPSEWQRTNACYGLAHVHSAAGQQQANAKRVRETQQAFEAAAGWYEKAGEAELAKKSLLRARNEVANLTGALDAVLAEETQHVLAAPTNPSAMDDIAALNELLKTASNAGDSFQANHLARELLNILEAAGFPEPQLGAVDDAWAAWIAASTPRASDRNALLAHPFLVMESHLRIIATRVMQVPAQSSERTAWENLFSELKLNSTHLEAQRQLGLADREFTAELGAYMPCGAEIAANPELAEAEAAALRINSLQQSFEAEYAAIEAPNDSRDYGVDRQDLIAAVAHLEQGAAELGSFFSARARLLHGSILIYDKQLHAAVDILDDARASLLSVCPGADPAKLNTMERDLYQLVLSRKVDALAELQDNAGVLGASNEAIRSIEAQRYFINSVEAQNAFLNWRLNFYISSIAAARRLEKWDQMLETIELVKARSIIRSALRPEPDTLKSAELLQEFERASEQLKADAAPEHADRRRRLWDLLTLDRARQGLVSEPPMVSVAAIQNELAGDEIAISYFMPAEEIVYALVVEREYFRVERIELKSKALTTWRLLVSCMEAGRGLGSLHVWLKTLGPRLIPQPIRERMKNKSRVIFSPHAKLHLFPFHGCPWDTGFIGQHFAVRYAPNLSSLLLHFADHPATDCLAIGISNFQPPIRALPQTEEEIRTAASMYKAAGVRADVLLGKDASVREVRSRLQTGHYRTVLFATHGTSVRDTINHPMEASLILADGWLDGLELSNLRSRPELAVLSACYSGERAVGGRGFDTGPGDDVFGLQSALFASGARAVLGALWPLEDAETCQLMSLFHRHHAAGLAADFALQRAIAEYLRERGPETRLETWCAWTLVTLGWNIRSAGSGLAPNSATEKI